MNIKLRMPNFYLSFFYMYFTSVQEKKSVCNLVSYEYLNIITQIQNDMIDFSFISKISEKVNVIAYKSNKC